MAFQFTLWIEAAEMVTFLTEVKSIDTKCLTETEDKKFMWVIVYKEHFKNIISWMDIKVSILWTYIFLIYSYIMSTIWSNS